jgi:hypothetical protein
MGWVSVVAAAWLVLAVAAAVLFGWSVRLADRKAAQREQVDPNVVADVLPPLPAPDARAAARTNERPARRDVEPLDGGDPGTTRPDRDVEAVPHLPAAHPGGPLRST